MFATSIALIKVSTLSLYQRIFITRRFSLTCYIVMGLSIAWFLASVLASSPEYLGGTAEPLHLQGQIFSSNPVSNAWVRPGHLVIDYSAFLLSLAAINTVLDLTIVILPLFMIRTLHMSPRRKLLVGGIFLLGTL